MYGKLMRSVRLTFILVSGSFSNTSLGAEPTPSRTTAITNVSTFDSKKERMASPRTVLIDGERISAIGEAVAIPEGALIVDGSGQFLIPGLIDAHVHLVHLSDRTQVSGEEFIPLFLAAGVTSVRSTGDAIAGQQRISHYVDDHRNICPRVFLASPIIDGDPPFHMDVGLAVTKVEDVPALVSELRKAEVTTLKIYVGMSRDIGRHLISEGHRQGLVFTGHLGRYSAQDAVADGIDCLEHIWSVLDYVIPRGETRRTCNLKNPTCLKLIAALKERNVAVDPTLVVFRNLVLLGDQSEYINHADNSLVPKRMQDGWRRLLKERSFGLESPQLRRDELRKYQELTAELYHAGITILAGTDAPEPLVCPGFSMHQELELLVESGIPSGAALNCATLHNARMLKQEKNLGSIETGKLADLVLLREDPVKDIRNSRAISKVIRGGIVMEAAEILATVPAK